MTEPEYRDEYTCESCEQYLDQSERYAELRDRFKAFEVSVEDPADIAAHEKRAELREAIISAQASMLRDYEEHVEDQAREHREAITTLRLKHFGELADLEARIRSLHMSATDGAFGAVLAIERLQLWEPIVKAAEESIAFTPILLTPALHRAVHTWLNYKKTRA